MASTYRRMMQSVSDRGRHIACEVLKLMKTHDQRIDRDRVPKDKEAKRIYLANYANGWHNAASRKMKSNDVVERFDIADSTIAGQGEQDGWNAAATDFQRIK